MAAPFRSEEDKGAFDRLVQTDARLRAVVEHANQRLANLHAPAPATIACGPPSNIAMPGPSRSPLSQIIYEMNLAIDRLESIVGRVDL
jgi:hypothetical protein